MRLAFYAPMKPPDHPVPSGDRRMARAFVGLLTSLGHEVELACRLRSYDRHGDTTRQRRLAEFGARVAAGLVRRYLRRAPGLRPSVWFTYHLYHKAPDWLGPVVSRALGIPYVVAEASVAGKQAAGAWAAGYAASRSAIAQADLVLAMTGQDRPALAAVVVAPERLRPFPPFLDARPFIAAAEGRAAARARLGAAWHLDVERPWLLAVAMMRADAKLLSYRQLVAALTLLTDLDWQLVMVGDGEAGAEVTTLMATFGHRVRLVGALPPAALPEIYATADLHVWPACNEAYGMALLEAQAAGVPVVAGAEGGVPDIVIDGETGVLVPPRQPAAFAAAVRGLLTDPTRRHAMGRAAQARVLTWHDTGVARARLAEALRVIGVQACTSA
jgi:glycosyltransferase involved in cell wall biosynthesis